MASTDLARLRAEYGDRPIALDPDKNAHDPLQLFERWLSDAITAQLAEPNAMALATASAEGRPSVRTVLLKSVDTNGLIFYTNYESRKGRELESNPYAAATMLWHQIHRQVRVEGSVSRTSPADSDAYFASRPRGSQISAAVSPQSHRIESRDALRARWSRFEASHASGDIARPASWGGYRITIEQIEFWQGRRNRLHERLRFTRSETTWTTQWLAP